MASTEMIAVFSLQSFSIGYFDELRFFRNYLILQTLAERNILTELYTPWLPISDNERNCEAREDRIEQIKFG